MMEYCSISLARVFLARIDSRRVLRRLDQHSFIVSTTVFIIYMKQKTVKKTILILSHLSIVITKK